MVRLTMENDQRYISLYIKRRRLMTEHAVRNAEAIDSLDKQLRELVDQGGVSQKAIENAAYIPWRGRSLI